MSHRMKKKNNLGFRPGPTQTGLYSHKRWLLEAENFGFRKKRNCTIRVVKTKALIFAELHPCFRLCRLLVFPCGGSYITLVKDDTFLCR